MADGDDKKLYNYTMKMMENITSHYLTTDFDKGTDVNKLIERGVARKIAAIMPNKYTEAEITVAEVSENLYVTATYSIDGDAEVVVIHKEQLMPEKAPSKMKAPTKLGISSRGCGGDFNERVAALKERLRKTEMVEYTSTCGTTEGRGSRVETLPVGKGIDELSDLAYFQKKLWDGLKMPPAPVACAPMTKKTPVDSEKPTIDFTQISQISAPTNEGLPRYESGMHVGIDLAKVNVIEQKIAYTMATEIRKEIDAAIIKDIMVAAEGISPWAVATAGWTEEKTVWDKPDGITWKSQFGYMPPTHSSFGGVLTTDNSAPTCDLSPMEIAFTEEELDELIVLIHDCESEVMKFA